MTIEQNAPGVTAQPPAKLREPSFPWWLRAFLPGLVIAAFGVAALRGPIADPDVFWHIRAGQWLPTTWQFVGPEPWTPTSSRPWVLHEWLPELPMGWVESSAGLVGISWLWSLSVVLVGISVWAICRRHAFMMLAGLVTGVALIAMSGSLTPRPHLITFALTALFVDAWLRSVEDLKPRWWLIPVSWVWACSHGMWFLGPVIGALVLGGALFDRRVPLHGLTRFVIVLAGTAVAGALTPIGPRLLLAPLHVGEYTQFVSEWQPAPLTSPQMIAFMILAGTVVLIWARAARAVPWSHLLLVVLAVGLALMYARTVAVGAAVLAPVAASTLQSVMGLRREPWHWREAGVTATVCLAGLVGAALFSPGGLGQQSIGPEDLAGEVTRLPDGTVICNHYNIGGWLLWRFPELHPAIDGRAEVYSVEHVRDSGRFMIGAPGWRDYLVTTGCSATLMPHDTPVLEDLAALGWTKAAEGEDYVLLIEG